MRRTPTLFLCVTAVVACDAVGGASGWKPVDTNGSRGQLHIVMSPPNVRIGAPEHVRLERVEVRTTKQDDGTSTEERRERTVRALSGHCEDNVLCDVAASGNEIVVTGRKFGDTTLKVTAVLDEKDEVIDTMAIRVLP
jgi:hypothetical protein